MGSTVDAVVEPSVVSVVSGVSSSVVVSSVVPLLSVLSVLPSVLSVVVVVVVPSVVVEVVVASGKVAGVVFLELIYHSKPPPTTAIPIIAFFSMLNHFSLLLLWESLGRYRMLRQVASNSFRKAFQPPSV